MMILKNEGVEERIKLDKALGKINNESKDEYSKEYELLTKMDKKKILSTATTKAKKTIQELGLLNTLYTMFFIAGALRYAVIMTSPWNLDMQL